MIYVVDMNVDKMSYLLARFFFSSAFICVRNMFRITIFITLSLKAIVFACICVKEDLPTLYNEFETTEYIFIGTVTNVTKIRRYGATGWSRDVQFDVNEYLKPSSSVSNNNSMMIYTANQRSACGLNMKLHQRWQVWATYTNFFSDDDEPQWLTADKCGRSTKIYNRNISLLRQWSMAKLISKHS